MAIITLTTDWQNDDFYVGAIKGLLYSKCPDVKVIDISHQIDPFKQNQAAFVLKNAYQHFPKGSIHLVGINSEISDKQPPICILINGHYFLGAASGIFSLMFSEDPEKVIQIKETEGLLNSSFPELTLFAEAAIRLANGESMDSLGEPLEGKPKYVQFMPAYDESDIVGNVSYIDSYQNIITNVSKELFDQVGKGRPVSITIIRDQYTINKISQSYNDVEVGEFLAIFNSLGLLELAMRNAQLAQLLKIEINSPVTVKFK